MYSSSYSQHQQRNEKCWKLKFVASNVRGNNRHENGEQNLRRCSSSFFAWNLENF